MSQVTSAVILLTFSAVILLAIWSVRTAIMGTFPPYDPVAKAAVFGGLPLSCAVVAVSVMAFRRYTSMLLGITLPLLALSGTALADLATELATAGAQMAFAPPILYAAYHLNRRGTIVCTVVGVALLSVVAFSLQATADAVHDVLFGGAMLIVLSGIVYRLRTKQRKALELVRREADHDPLTGLVNRQAFMKMLARHLARREEAVALLLIDVDHFKVFNDTYGHPAGDAILQQVSSVLLAASPHHSVVARIGGDEFAVLLPEADAKAASTAAETLRRQVFESSTVVSGGHAVSVSLSIGVAHRDGARLTPDDHLAPVRPEWDVDQFYTICDYALYEAKRGGRGCVRLAGSSITEESMPVRQPNRRRAAHPTQEDAWVS